MVPNEIWILVMPASGQPLSADLLDRCKRLERACRRVDEMIDLISRVDHDEARALYAEIA